MIPFREAFQITSIAIKILYQKKQILILKMRLVIHFTFKLILWNGLKKILIHTKLDIYQKAFNKEQGWEIYDLDPKNRVLLIRIDVLTQSFKTAFSLTVNINELFITNRREDDMLSDRYKCLKLIMVRKGQV